VVAKDTSDQINFILKGIKEYEFFDNGNVDLTLFRSVG
jgi:hypothetical protein